MDLKNQLQKLFERYEADLGDYAWFYESDRWVELVFCLLNQCINQDPEVTRQAVDTLQYLDLLQIDKLVFLEKTTHENTVVVAYVLKTHGFSKKDAQRSIGLLAQAAKAIQKDYGGKIQRCLRQHGLSIRDELVNAFRGKTLDEEHLRYAISHWLQNVFSIPISLEHNAVIEFCERNAVTLEDLLFATDELNLNMALVDDLLELEMEQEARGITEGPSHTATEG